MSNPAVIMLVDTNTKSGGRFKVEDNIGESIHIHYDNFRMDLTIEQFISFSTLIEEALVNLINNETFNIENFDPMFLYEISYMLKDLKCVSHEKIKLSDMIVSKEGLFGIPRWSDLYGSRVYRAINGDSKENDNYIQENFFNQSNQERVNKIKELVERKSYPYNDEYIVLVNNQNYIRDGQHRALSILSVEGDSSVPIIRLHFKNNKYSLKKYRWINFLIPHLKKLLKKIIKKIIKKVRNILKGNDLCT